MKAAIYTKYGPPEVLHISEVEKPVPTDNEVLVKVLATTVTLYDCWMRSSTAPPGFWLPSRIASGIRKPKVPILGIDLAGVIEVVGKNVKRFKEGDHVYGFSKSMGTYAEYACILEDKALALKPSNMTFEEAACVSYGALTALFFLRKAHIKSGQKVLVFGASGGLGIAAVQLAKHFGTEVTGICSTKKMELVRSLGADEVIDYTKEDFTKKEQTYDIIFDTVGKSSVLRSKRSLKKKGTYVFATFGLPKLFPLLWLKLFSRKKVVIGLVKALAEDLVFLKEFVETGRLKSVIDKTYPLEQIAEAHRYFETGKKKGTVVITVNHG